MILLENITIFAHEKLHKLNISMDDVNVNVLIGRKVGAKHFFVYAVSFSKTL